MIYASLPKRVLGHIIDNIVIDFIASFAIFVFGDIGFVISMGILTIIYNTLMMGSSWHATVGQRILNMRVVDRNGNGIDYTQALIRSLCSYLSIILIFIGYVVALFSDRKQTLHDKLAETYVVDSVPASNYHANNNTNVHGRIIGISGEKSGKSYIIPAGGVMIGRDPSVCKIVMGNARGVSRCHCFITYSASTGLYTVTDHNSSYGTFTQSGVRISSKTGTVLRSGDRFYIGSTENIFECC